MALDLGYGPYFSWIFEAGYEDGFLQSAYRIILTKTGAAVPYWDSGKVESASQHMVVYGGPPLEYDNSYMVQVTLWNAQGREAVRGFMTFETGIDGLTLGCGTWIGGGLMRRVFPLSGKVKKARAYVTCVGYYELFINGKRAGDLRLTPSYTGLHKRIEFQAYDVSSLLNAGDNVMGLSLGRGMQGIGPFSIPEPFVLCLLALEMEDGSRVSIRSDEEWQCLPDPVVRNSIYQGEVYDARMEQENWCNAGYAGPHSAVKVFEAPAGKLTPQILPPIRIVEERLPLSITKNPGDIFILDYGQNLTGVVRLSVTAEQGRTVTLRHAEILDGRGFVDQRNLRILNLSDVYIAKGSGQETYEPRFTYHGFRYVQVEGYPGKPEPENFIACVIRSDVPRTGNFECSDEQYNRIHEAMRWTLTGNLHGIPTDCPQRNERHGWMGDGHIASDANIYNSDMHWFYRKWLDDLRDVVDEETGEVLCAIAPGTKWGNSHFFAWEATEFIIPWNLWRYYGDWDVVERSYPLLCKILKFYDRWRGENGLIMAIEQFDTSFPWDHTFNDWLAPDRTRDIQIINGFYYQEHKILEEFAALLGLEDERAKYAQAGENIKKAYNELFISPDSNVPVPNGVYGLAYDISQYAQALPLSLDLVPADQQQLAFDFLLWDIEHARGSPQLSTGIFGTKCVVELLEKNNRNDLVAALFSRKTYPGWGFMLEHGATTIWERWLYMVSAEMNSHNHPALAAPDTWFYRSLAGLDYGYYGSDGRRVFVIKPYPAPGMDFARAECLTPWGQVTTHWHRTQGEPVLDIQVPANTRAEVYWKGAMITVSAGKHSFR
jgi:alpha-L-rhamnosidase